MARGRWCGWSGAARRSGSTGSPPARRRGEAAMRPTSLCPAPRGQEPVRPAPPREPPWPWLGLWAVVAVVVGALVRVLGPAVLDPDEYAAALYFDDLVHGRRLQEFLLSAPKPLLTLVHGLAWTVTHDWRAGTALTVAAFALAVAALARAAWRLAGAPAALAVAISLSARARWCSRSRGGTRWSGRRRAGRLRWTRWRGRDGAGAWPPPRCCWPGWRAPRPGCCCRLRPCSACWPGGGGSAAPCCCWCRWRRRCCGSATTTCWPATPSTR